jgi:GxxExxY protein
MLQMEGDFLYKSETYQIIGALMEVHRELGCGFLEPIYQEALAIEFDNQLIPFEAEKKISVNYKGIPLDKFYVADFVCFDKIIVELKALSALNTDHEAQIINYLNATGLKVGLLVNFGEKSLKYKRFVY